MIGRAHLSDSSCWTPSGRFRCSKSPCASQAVPPSIKVLAATPCPCAVIRASNLLARGLKPIGAISTLIVAGGEGSTPRQSATRR